MEFFQLKQKRKKRTLISRISGHVAMSGSKNETIEAESEGCEDIIEIEEVDGVGSGVEDEKEGREYEMEDGEVDEDEWCKFGL